MKGKVAGIFLLFCLVAPIPATFTFLHYQKKQIKKEIKRQIIIGINKEELVLLKFAKNESETLLHWKHSKEFEYDGQMYDIVETENRGDTTCYWCWLDNEETKLNKQLDELLASALGKDTKNIEHKDRLVFFLKSLFFSEYEGWDIYSFQSALMFYPYIYNYNKISYPPPVPPP